MERCSPACTQLLTLDCYNTLKIFQAKNKLFKACEGNPHPPLPALSKLHFHAIKRFLWAREGADGACSSSGYSCLSPHQGTPSQLSSSTASRAKLQSRALCQLRNHHCPGRTVSHCPAFAVFSTAPKNLLCQHNWNSCGTAGTRNWRGKEKRWAPLLQALSPSKWMGNHWLHSIYHRSAQHGQAAFSKDCYYSMNLKKEKVI